MSHFGCIFIEITPNCMTKILHDCCVTLYDNLIVHVPANILKILFKGITLMSLLTMAAMLVSITDVMFCDSMGCAQPR